MSISEISVSSISTNSHAKRVKDLNQRLDSLNSEAKQLNEFLQVKLHTEEIDSEEKFTEMGYELKQCEETTPIGQLNSRYSRFFKIQTSKSKRSMFCRFFPFKQMQEQDKCYYAQMTDISLKILRYLGQNEAISNYIVRLFEIYKRDNSLYIFHKRFEVKCSLAHKIWNFEDLALSLVKKWIVQLADAAEMLNVSGVAHRLIRCENVLITLDNRIKLTCFDMACLYWNSEEKKVIMQKKGLPGEWDPYWLSHLPPECFNMEYDASDLDVWSIGVIACLLITRNNPFNIQKNDFVAQWNGCWERRILPEEVRTLLDDIFQTANKRMMLFDLKNDIRLTETNTKIQARRYYRIDVIKNVNVSTNEQAKNSKKKFHYLPQPEYNNKTKDIYELQCFKIGENEEIFDEAGICILRDKSFFDEFDKFFKDFYMRYTCNNTDGVVKVYMLNSIPIRHRNMLLNESVKIMRYFSMNEPVPGDYIHKITDTFVIENKLYIFYENLTNAKSLYQISLEEINISSKKIKKWMIQLAELVEFLSLYAISHRYIRPEFVFIENKKIKVTHFDMACFVCNPVENIQVARHRGLQDELQFQWNHLPPECFDDKYDSLAVDVWSIGALLTFCLAQEVPFIVPFNIEEATTMWNSFKKKFKSKLYPYEEILNRIFVNNENRIKCHSLLKKFKSIEIKCKSHKSTRSTNHTKSTISGNKVSASSVLSGTRNSVSSNILSGTKVSANSNAQSGTKVVVSSNVVFGPKASATTNVVPGAKASATSITSGKKKASASPNLSGAKVSTISNLSGTKISSADVISRCSKTESKNERNSSRISNKKKGLSKSTKKSRAAKSQQKKPCSKSAN